MTTLTKKMAEDLADYLAELGIKVQWLHSEVDTLERVEILRDLRLGVYDVLVGINLLREGLDLPEVTLVAILDADKEGFLRSGGSLIQVIGRAARNIGGGVIMYADRETDSMRAAIEETTGAGPNQVAYNAEHGIVPRRSSRRSATSTPGCAASPRSAPSSTCEQGAGRAVDDGPARGADEGGGRNLEFERAAALRDEILQLRRLRVLQEDASITVGRAAERAAKDSSNGRGLTGAADRARGRRGGCRRGRGRIRRWRSPA